MATHSRSVLAADLGVAPYEVLPVPLAIVLAALMRLDRPTLATVAEATGRARSTTYRSLLRLQELGLVQWHGAGTLRPTFVCAWPEYMLEER